jgi:selenide,water dikinase
VLVDYRTGDDAGVFRLDERTALVQTVDFFTPVVDDPGAFGAIAAANALSDVYAMGGQPLTALSIAAFPERGFPPEWAAAIVRGGHDKLREAGCALLGGHSVRDPEIKFGYAVTGIIDPERMLTNAGARAGDALLLTKPLGTGLVATALKAGKAPPDAVAAATRSMVTLNRIPSAVALRHGARAATDVTGFGLAGHALAVARESAVTLEIEIERLPVLPGALELSGHQPGGLKANRARFEPEIAWEGRPAAALQALVFSPETSGGLLLCVPEGHREAVLEELTQAVEVGRVRPRSERGLVLTSPA